MGFTGVWVVAALPDTELARLPEADELFVPPVEVGGERTWWEEVHERGRAGRGTRRLWEDEDADRLGRLIGGWYGETGPAEEFRGAVMGQLEGWGPEPEPEWFFAAVARKAFPFGALAYGVGPGAVLALPGWFGEFVLTADQVRERLPEFEAALEWSGEERERVLDRLRAWLADLGDAPDHPAEELLDGPLRVARWAAARGWGLVGVAPVY
ncbi:hypothetical protein Kpho02_27810 [Kitasatospora phosalacinea]|uniref:Uncharacterized protein n=1 Tax=Kitasatospora phosalacinea TaxID=2065 RepID=A0A9W6Q9E8_9ACTN|nr:hypothetical protein [Kitasatospora phosalacinea]GLW70482.1 hypothetical protein Kpho02_27810 [Kitasatospora phosalacinea]